MLGDREKLQKKISAMDFAIHDTELFLDSHRDNKKAAELLCKERKWRRDLIEEYEEKYGDFSVLVEDAKSETPWDWTDGPWPWEYSEENI